MVLKFVFEKREFSAYGQKWSTLLTDMMRNDGDLTIVDYDQRINDLRLYYCL
jgi:hypothetical protein